MTQPHLTISKVRRLLASGQSRRILVLGDVMLDHFLWGKVGRISPEAPVPIVEFDRESFIPGGAGNVARNLADLNVATELLGVIGRDETGPACAESSSTIASAALVFLPMIGA